MVTWGVQEFTSRYFGSLHLQAQSDSISPQQFLKGELQIWDIHKNGKKSEKICVEHARCPYRHYIDHYKYYRSPSSKGPETHNYALRILWSGDLT